MLAGGLGSRLRHIVTDVPKPMAPVAGHPFLEIVLSNLACNGFKRIVLSIGYLANKIVSHFGTHFRGMDICYEIESVPLGTGGAIRASLERCFEDHVFVFNGDTFLSLEIADVEENWKRHRTPILVAREVQDTVRYGRLSVVDGAVRSFLEKGVSGPGLINAGCYVLPRGLMRGVELGKQFSLETEFLAAQVQCNRFDVYVTKGYFLDIGVPEDYERAQTELTDFVIPHPPKISGA